MACSNPSRASGADIPPRAAIVSVRTPKAAPVLTLLCLAFSAHGQEPAATNQVTEMDAVQVTATRPQELYRSKPVERTPPTVFERDWREPVNLRQIGLEGGVVPLLVRYAGGQARKGAEQIPGWKKQVQPAIARPPPLDESQLQRATELQDAP